MTYKYTVSNMGINGWNKFINKRDLVKVEQLNRRTYLRVLNGGIII